jgi:hypothetical protein
MDPRVNEISWGEIETIIRVDRICVEVLYNRCLTRNWFLFGKVPPHIRKKKAGPLSASHFRLLGGLELIQTTTEITRCPSRSENARNVILLVKFSGNVYLSLS